ARGHEQRRLRRRRRHAGDLRAGGGPLGGRRRRGRGGGGRCGGRRRGGCPRRGRGGDDRGGTGRGGRRPGRPRLGADPGGELLRHDAHVQAGHLRPAHLRVRRPVLRGGGAVRDRQRRGGLERE